MDSTRLTELLTQDNFSKEIAAYLPTTKNTNTNFVENAVIQPNNISKAVYNCNASAQKLFTFLIKKFKTEKRTSKSRCFEISENETKNLLNFTKKTQVKTALQELKTLSIFIETDEIYKEYSLIDYFEFNKKQGDVKIELGVRFSELLEKKLTGNFTTLDFSTVVNLSNFYSIRFYEIAMSWQGIKGKYHKPKTSFYKENIEPFYSKSWFFGYSIEQLKIILDIADKYDDIRNFIKRIITTPIDILNESQSEYRFIPEIIRDSDKTRIDKKTGETVNFGKVKGVIIWIIDESSKVQIYSTDSIVKQIEKKELNEDAKKYDEAMLYKRNHPEEWNQQEKLSREKLEKEYGCNVMDILVQMDCYETLIKEEK